MTSELATFPAKESRIDNDYLTEPYDPLVEGIGPALDSPLDAHLSDGKEDDSVSEGIG